MKKKYLMAALMCTVCLAVNSFAGAVSAEETEEAAETEAESGQKEQASLEERPDYRALDYVTLGKYKGLEIEIDPTEFVVTEEDVEDRIREELQMADLFEKVSDGQVQDGDIVNIDYEGKLDGEAFDGGTAQGFDLEIGSQVFIDGFEDGLIGMTVGETADLPLTFPETYGEDKLAGKDVIFTVTVNSISRMPELTDELAGKVSENEFGDAASYRDHIREILQTEMDSQKLNRIYGELVTLIANVSKVNDYPAELVEYTVEGMRSYYRQYAEAFGMEYEEFLENQLQMTSEEFEETAAAAVKQLLRQELLLKAIAETENIEVSDEEFAAGCEKYAEEEGYESSGEFLDAYGEKVVRLSLLQDKVMEFVRSSAVIDEIAETESETADTASGETGEKTTAETTAG